MRAFAVPGRGESAVVTDVADPDPVQGEVVVAVQAASLNGFDAAVAAGYVWDVMPHEFPVTLGRDFVGRLTDSADRVAGIIAAPQLGPGAIAERVVASSATLARVPANLPADHAAAVGLAAITASDVVVALDLHDGDTVFVSGATGGVGAYVVQLAAATGARVIATARPGAAADFARKLGATETVDYDEAPGTHVTHVVHAAGDPVALAGVLSPGGQFVSVLGAEKHQLGRDDISVVALRAAPDPTKLEALLRQVADGHLVAPIDERYPLDRAAEALDAFTTTGKLGKIILTIPGKE